MTILEACEPIFTKVCLLNRLGRQGTGFIGFDQIRLEVKTLFESVAKAAAADPALKVQWDKVELPLIFFVDSMISESGLQIAGEWHRKRLAYERKELAGDEKFFDSLDENLKDPSDEASQRLLVYYTCIGVGFAGWYAGQPEYLRGKMLDISQRVRTAMDLPPVARSQEKPARICPEAYEGVDTRDLVQPPASNLGGILILFLGLCLIVFTVEIYLFRSASLSLTESLSAITAQERGK
ncbi:MAG: DotU family type IV/VI secretion system protein [Verrucomicrobia bacterium]|nr:DotU family type IV/VI secretion system protein [Verrucomicrobiota bacterium]MBV9674491.1 DotU family type IV/VI secretion system protein [Verrucomicrobiota bacterium]